MDNTVIFTFTSACEKLLNTYKSEAVKRVAASKNPAGLYIDYTIELSEFAEPYVINNPDVANVIEMIEEAYETYYRIFIQQLQES